MATLKSIKNKYLTTSDGDVLGVTTNTENITALGFKLATADSLSKFNMVDGFVDDYNDATGVDAGTSSGETRNATNNYYSGGSVLSPTGGTITVVGDYRYHLFTSNGDFVVPSGGSGNIEALVLAGGAGGGEGGRSSDNGRGGGGGAGGLVHDTALAVTTNTYPMVIGTGGAGGVGGGVAGIDGTNSTGFGWTAVGGGGGSVWNGGQGRAGGSGGQGGSPSGPGGASTQASAGTGSSGTRTAYGTAGAGFSNNDHGGGARDAGGGGGHALYIANFAAGSIGGNRPINETPDTTYGWFGGGGGGAETTTAYYSGAGAGMGQGNPNPGSAATGTWGSGGGGGGAWGSGGYPNSGRPGGAGSPGCVAIRYATDTFQLAQNMTLLSNAFTAQADPTTTRIILDESPAVGTTTVNTDIKAYASRDNGTTYTQITLASQGDLVTKNQGGIDQYTKLMLHCDGANAGTTFTDSSSDYSGQTAHSITASAGAQTGTAIKKFGTAACLLDGVDDKLWTAPSSDWTIGTGDYTWDCWAYGTSWTGYRNILNQNPENFALYYATATTTLDVVQANTTFTFAWTPSNDTWYHLAVTRTSGSLRVFVDGSQIGSTTAAAQDITGTAGNGYLYMGSNPGSTDSFAGSLDEIRFSNGVSRWSADFTPPTVPYTIGAPAVETRRLLSGSVDISGQPAGSNVKYKIETLNQSISKETRIYGTSMAWA